MFEGISNWLYEMFGSSDHKHWYTINMSDSSDVFSTLGTHSDNLLYSQSHPILTAGMLFVSNLFAQAEFVIKDRNGKIINDNKANKFIRLLERPNYYQSRVDFLEAMQWIKIARGNVVIYTKRTPGFEDPDSLYVLDPHRIKYPKNFKTPMAFSPTDRRIGNQTVIYRETNDDKDNINIKLSDLIYLYDLPNILKPNNKLLTGSRLDGLHQTLDNTVDSLVAKNIILRSNGKEMLSSDNPDGFPLDADQEVEAKRVFNTGYGLSPNRDRAFITNASLKWQSMHIALRDLGLDESTKVDGNIVYTALHIPKDILSLEAKKTTYNNFRESMTSFIQNDINSMVKDFALKLSVSLLPDDRILIGSYDHLPVMSYLKKEQINATNSQIDALKKCLDLGMNEADSLELCGLDKTIKLDYEKDTNEQTTPTEPKAILRRIKEA